MSTQFTAYKHANDCFIVVLQSLPDTISNLGRPGVVDMYHAKFRMNRALVVDIYHRDTKEKKTSATSMHNQNFVYTVGQIVSEPRYDPDPSIVCAQGIHFFLSEEAAYYFACATPENGVIKSWTDDGKPDFHFVCATRENGVVKSWSDNGSEKHYPDFYRLCFNFLKKVLYRR